MIVPPSPGTAPRVAYLESIRGLAAVQVILLHFFAAFAPDLVFAPSAGAHLAGYVHLSPLYFLYDGYSAVYIFFVLSGYVLSRSFARPAPPLALIASRAIRLGVPALAATMLAAIVLVAFGRPNAEVGAIVGSDWFARQWNPQLSLAAVLKDGILNALLLGYEGLPGVAFLAPWQQPVEQSFAAPLWTLSIEFYGSLIVMALCWAARRSRALWWALVVLGAAFTIRSAYVCFFVGHVAAAFALAEKPVAARPLRALACIAGGVFVCVLAEVWQPEWLRNFCSASTWWLFPGQFAPLQQKAYGAILVLAGIIDLAAARRWLASPWLVARSRLSFPLYLTHWPILFGPAAALFLLLHETAGLEIARGCAVVAGIALAVLAAVLFEPVDRFAVDLSRRWRKPLRTAAAPVVVATAIAAE